MDVDMKEVSSSNEAAVRRICGRPAIYIYYREYLDLSVFERGRKRRLSAVCDRKPELFEVLAEKVISKGGDGPFVIDRDLLVTYFQ